MALDKSVAELMNKQINEELFSAYLYLTFADYYEDRGLKGFANWYMVQVQEEVSHAKILRRYLLDNDVQVKMLAIAEPDKVFTDDLAPLLVGQEHERYITECINRCYAAAADVRDFRTMQLLDWFVKEQGEEETNASDMVKNMQLFGSDPKGLYDLDREYQARVFVAPTRPMQQAGGRSRVRLCARREDGRVRRRLWLAHGRGSVYSKQLRVSKAGPTGPHLSAPCGSCLVRR